MDEADAHPRLSVLILTRNEAENLRALIPEVRDILAAAQIDHEIVVVDAASSDGTAGAAIELGVRVLEQERPGYANALRQGFQACGGSIVLTIDADLSHRPAFVLDLLRALESADVVIASRYVRGGSADMSLTRRVLSIVLNRVFGMALGLDTRDLSSGFRAYRASTLRAIDSRGDYFDVLPEIVALSHLSGHRVREVPFHYHPREAGVSKARVLKFAPSYVRTIARCWRLRRERARAEQHP